MPFALEEYKKTKIDYSIFERARRNKPTNRERITNYLLDDCIYLHELITGFREIVGAKDTIGSAAFYQMRQLGIEIQSLNETHDDMFRPYFFGGRVQAFEKGLINGPLQYLDINSAYPYAMRSDHAHGPNYKHTARIPRSRERLQQSFIHGIFESRGALPVRENDGGIGFPISNELEAFATGWEISAGLETKTLRVLKVHDVWTPQTTINFSSYVDRFFALRATAKKAGDEVKRIAYKYLLNSGFGKFAQNPRDFREYVLAPFGKAVKGYEWENDFGAVTLWSKPSYVGRGFFDVCTASSITGFERANLWRGVCASKGVAYIDTDAMFCRSSTVKLGEKLGEWKKEGGENNFVKRMAIAGKKLYGIEWAKKVEGESHKIASKGARLDWSDLLALCKGKTIKWTNEAPTFSINGAHFITRDIRAT